MIRPTYTIDEVAAAPEYPGRVTGAAGCSWQPIETAPHDVDVLLFTPAVPGTISREQPVYEVRPYSFGRPGSRSFHAFATHWMPLPDPPK